MRVLEKTQRDEELHKISYIQNTYIIYIGIQVIILYFCLLLLQMSGQLVST